MPKKKFIKLKRALTSQYLNKKVPCKYQKRYGKRYGKKDIESFAYAVARSKKIKV